MEPVIHLLSGWVGGVTGCIVSYPLDTIKTLIQYDPVKYNSAAVTARRVYADGGLPAFYRGCAVPASMVGVLYAVTFLTYGVLDQMMRNILKFTDEGMLNEDPVDGKKKESVSHEEHHITDVDPQVLLEVAVADVDMVPPLRRVEKVSKQLPLSAVAACGALTGVVTSLFQGPAELLKVKQQVASSSGGDYRLSAVARQVWAAEGGRGLGRGLGATLCRDVPGTAVWFLVYEAVKRRICANASKPDGVESLIAGGTSGLVYCSLIYPLDVVKTAIQADLHGSSTKVRYTHVVSQLYKTGGMRKFYAGILPSLARSFVGNGATFFGRDKSYQFLQQWKEQRKAKGT